MMNAAFARTSYRKTETALVPEVNSPHQIISATLRELDRSLGILVTAQQAGRTLPADHLNKVFTAIYILQSSLDFEQGGEVAVSLFQVYEYCRVQALKAFRKEDGAQLSESREAIDGILSAWNQIGPEVEAKAQ